MSPEQATGGPIDARSDIFSLGIVLYEAAGHRPFAGSNDIDLLHAVVHDAPSPLTNVPAELQWILEKALAKDVEERYQTMREFAADLRRLERRVEQPSPSQHGAPTIPRSRLWPDRLLGAGFALASIIALGAVPAVRTRLFRNAPSLPVEAKIIQLTRYSGTERSGALSPDGKHFAFVSEKGGRPDIWIRQVSGGELLQITHDAAAESEIVYSPDGESLYFERTEGGAANASIWRVAALGGTARKILDGSRLPAPRQITSDWRSRAATISKSPTLTEPPRGASTRAFVRSNFLPGPRTADGWRSPRARFLTSCKFT
jgi:hypothetical protein